MQWRKIARTLKVRKTFSTLCIAQNKPEKRRNGDAKQVLSEGEMKGTIEEELYDVLYYVLAIANIYNVDITKWIYLKEKYNDSKYGRNSVDALFDK